MLRTDITEATKTSMKAQNKTATSALRLISAALKDRDIAARSKGNMDGITDDEILSMMQSMIKQRGDSIEMYEKGGREELAQKERDEITIIQQFLPKQMDDAEMAEAVDAVIAELSANSLKDMGKVMGVLKEKHAGQMDFGQASKLVKTRLG